MTTRESFTNFKESICKIFQIKQKKGKMVLTKKHRKAPGTFSAQQQRRPAAHFPLHPEPVCPLLLSLTDRWAPRMTPASTPAFFPKFQRGSN
jgi:hypothetical protein